MYSEKGRGTTFKIFFPAGEMIAEGALAIEMGATAEDVATTIHPHPTLSETYQDVADMFGMGATH